MNTDHDQNWHRNNITHNLMLLSNEPNKKSKLRYGTGAVNTARKKAKGFIILSNNEEDFEFTFFFFLFLNLELETCYKQHFGTENWYMHPYNKTKYVDLKKYAFI